MTAKIKKIVLDVDGSKIELTLSQAKELQKILNETFGETKYLPSYPIVIEQPVRRVYPSWYYDGGTTVTFSLSSDKLLAEG